MNLAAVFCDGMVLQAHCPIRIFGSGEGKAEVQFQGKRYPATVSAGKWTAELPAMSYGGPYEMIVRMNGEKRILQNIMIGEVYLCAGQSNMQFRICDEIRGGEEHGNPHVRYYLSPYPECHGEKPLNGWVVATGDPLQKISALGFHIADGIARKKNITVGIVGCFQGASTIQSWIPEGRLTGELDIPFADRFFDSRYEECFWNHRDGTCYRSTFEPLVPFSFAAVIWYQGESNTSEAESVVYGKMLKEMIADWRAELKSPELPFFAVQIADYLPRADSPAWYRVQEELARAEASENAVYSVRSADVCENKQIHPCNKRPLAERIVRRVLKETE